MPTAVAKQAEGDSNIVDVWQSNLEEEFKRIRKVVRRGYGEYIAMDTEFPGIVARPMGNFTSPATYSYQLLRANVNILKLIQVGFTFLNSNGETPPEGEPSTWQFNFKFNLQTDMFASDSIKLLEESGIKFSRNEEDGVDPFAFAELLTTSGIVLNENVRWLSFHSGYDFGYLLKLLTNSHLPDEETDFFELFRIFFPRVYDVKYLIKSCKNLKGGLQEIADQLEIQRIGPQHQAGSDSLLTGSTFFRLKSLFFEDSIDDSKYLGHLYGLGATFTSGAYAFEAALAAASSTQSALNTNANNASQMSANNSLIGSTLSSTSNMAALVGPADFVPKRRFGPPPIRSAAIPLVSDVNDKRMRLGGAATPNSAASGGSNKQQSAAASASGGASQTSASAERDDDAAERSGEDAMAGSDRERDRPPSVNVSGNFDDTSKKDADASMHASQDDTDGAKRDDSMMLSKDDLDESTRNEA